MFSALGKGRATHKPDQAMIHELYQAVTHMSRAPVFYTRFSVPDTTDGRYDLLCLMLSLFLFRLQQAEPDTAQALFDLSFKDMERGLREVGVGDLGIPKHMKRMLQAFYGRAAAYYEALEQRETEGLAIVLARNLYNQDMTMSAIQMAEWVTIFWQFLSQVAIEDLKSDPHLVYALVPPEEAIEKTEE